MEEVQEGKDYSFPGQEEIVLNFWDEIKAFEGQLERTKGQKSFVFYDGPPFATGLPHYGHLLAGTIKDVVTRYASTTGHYCPRRFGWDCHGLPVENEINKKLNIKGREGVLQMGIDNYNEECRSIVMRYSHEWEKTVRRAGRWIDFKNDYKTLNLEFMESVWWVFGQIYQQGLVYKGMKVMPYSWKLSTTISNNEASENYKETSDPAITVSFPLDDDPDNAEVLAWTTTPWTLPSNLALCVHPNFVYLKVKNVKTGKAYIIAESRLKELPGAVQKAKKGQQDGDSLNPDWQIVAKYQGKELKNKRYQPMFPYFAHLKSDQQDGDATPTGAFRVVCDTYVTSEDGTGIVHNAPFFGEDDLRVCLANGIIEAATITRCPVDADGKFTSDIPEYQGRHVKQYDQVTKKAGKEELVLYNASKENPDYDIIKAIKEKGRLLANNSVKHKVPFCPRSNTPLIYKAVDSWFIKVEHLRSKLWDNTAQTYWVPEKVKEGRFRNWLASSRDWAVSRSRFWGTPIPIWISDDGEERVVVSSVEELKQLTGTSEDIKDLHRHKIDHLTIPSRQGKGVLRRIDDVFDCWFESGSMPYGQLHYPFENQEFFQSGFPADFVAEGIDQTRGWFYSLMVLSTILFDKPAFKNLVCNGMVLAADGKKMSKSLRNYPDPVEILNDYGADAMRLYLITSPVVHGDNLAFNRAGVQDVIRSVFLPWYNAYRFLVQNVLRHQTESGTPFRPAEVNIDKATNALDRWIAASTRALIAFVREEMSEYRLYTVVPRLVKFIDSLTNVYVRYNRKRLKGDNSPEDCLFALSSLYDVLLKLCKLMAPFTPFFCETLYQNLKKSLPPGEPQSVHWCSLPEITAELADDTEVQEGVEKMVQVIELARQIRERKVKPLKQPLEELIIVHPSTAILGALDGHLKPYIVQETNVRKVTTCADPERFGVLRAEPVFAKIGQKFKTRIPALKAAISKLSRDEIVGFESSGKIVVEGCELVAGDMKVLNDFKAPEGSDPTELDAAVEGQLMAILDLRLNDSLAEERLGREVLNRVQKLRKKAGLVPDDAVNVYLELSPKLAAPVQSQAENMAETLKQRPKQLHERAKDEIEIASETYTLQYAGSDEQLTVVLTRAAVLYNESAILQVAGGSKEKAKNIIIWLKSRDLQHLAHLSNHGQNAVDFVLDGESWRLKQGEHFSLP